MSASQSEVGALPHGVAPPTDDVFGSAHGEMAGATGPTSSGASPAPVSGVPEAADARRTPAPEGSAGAKLLAAAVLEVLAGIRTPASASDALEMPVSRYYMLEDRAVQGLIDALEDRPRGRRRSSEAEIAKLQQEKQQLERELARVQALVRATERVMGALPHLPIKPHVSSNGQRGKRRAKVRATKAITVLRAGVAAARVATEPTDSDAV